MKYHELPTPRNKHKWVYVSDSMRIHTKRRHLNTFNNTGTPPFVDKVVLLKIFTSQLLIAPKEHSREKLVIFAAIVLG